MAKRSVKSAPSRRSAVVDDIDLRILGLLREDGRASVAAIAQAVGISRANAYARLERMRSAGVIEGFSARVRPDALGLGVTAIIFLDVRSPARESLSGPLREIPGIEYAAFVTGEHDVVVVVRAPDVTDLRERIMVPLYQQPAVRSTHTVIVLDEIVHRPFVMP